MLLKKASNAAGTSGAWDSIHVLEVVERGRSSKYKLTSTVILNLGSSSEALGKLDLSGNMTRQVEQDLPADGDEAHVCNIGRMVEDMELKMRNLLRKSAMGNGWSVADCVTEEVYFGKAKDVVGDLRSRYTIVWAGAMLIPRRLCVTFRNQQGQSNAQGDDQQHVEMSDSGYILRMLCMGLDLWLETSDMASLLSSRRSITVTGNCFPVWLWLDSSTIRARLRPRQTELIHLDGELEDIIQTTRISLRIRPLVRQTYLSQSVLACATSLPQT